MGRCHRTEIENFVFPAYIRFTSGLENLDLLKVIMIRTGKSLVINVNVLMGGLEPLDKVI